MPVKPSEATCLATPSATMASISSEKARPTGTNPVTVLENPAGLRYYAFLIETASQQAASPPMFDISSKIR